MEKKQCVAFNLFPLAFINCIPQDTSVCVYVKLAMIMDCSDRGFERLPMPEAKHKTEKIVVLDLKRNNVSLAAEKNVLRHYPWNSRT